MMDAGRNNRISNNGIGCTDGSVSTDSIGIGIEIGNVLVLVITMLIIYSMIVFIMCQTCVKHALWYLNIEYYCVLFILLLIPWY
jgi:hypothetical protein